MRKIGNWDIAIQYFDKLGNLKTEIIRNVISVLKDDVYTNESELWLEYVDNREHKILKVIESKIKRFDFIEKEQNENK